MMETLDKKDIFYIHKTNKLLMVIITFFVFLISIAYSALNSTLMVTGDLVYRTKGDIRITDVKINGVTNDGVEQYSPKYTKNTVSLGMKLPNLNSTVTYEVTIKNSSSNKYKISNITDEMPGNPNIDYTHNYISDTTIGANSTTTVLLTYKYNSSVTTLPSDILKETTISFAFKKTGNLLYDKIKKDYESGGNVKVYTGDKSTFIGDKAVYYYYGETLNNNVLFAGFCWRMYRTTETGGVKIIYNGVPSSGQCNKTGISSTIGNGAFNSSYNSPAYVGYMYNKVYTYNVKVATSSYLYGNSFTYSGGTYTLTNTQSVTLSSSTVSSLVSKHYTCWNTTGTCTTLSYVYYVYNDNVADYINLTGGTSIEQALDEMLYDDNVNTTNSTIKTTIDNWYKNNMTGYTSYLEDTIWCNDRSIYNKAGWNPNGGSMTPYLYFNSEGNPTNLTCQNKNDRFTVSSTNGNGKLTYPVGLVTSQEQNLAYYSSNSPIQNGGIFWTLSPRHFYLDHAAGFVVYAESGCKYNLIEYSNLVRPAVSLHADIEYSSGDGTSANPFVMDAPSKIDRTLYGKIKKDYESGGNIELYTGDKSTFIGDKDVYYYKGATANNNVIFAGFCWKMYRTTESGGVKMIYNGVPSSGQCNKTGSASTIGKSAFNSSYTSPAYVGYMYNKVYTYNAKSLSSIPSYLYGNSFTYSGETYTLTNTQSVTLSYSTASSLASKHYTCWNTTGTCTTLSYVYYVYNGSTAYAYYINLTGGTSIEQALNEMLYDDNVNTTNSTIKTTIDTWYQNNMTGYTSYLEDTIWCNDRSRNNPTGDGWNPNGGSMITYLYFKSEGNTTNLTCQNKNDRFTVSSTNGNGKLTYPVGLVTSQEQNLAYYSSNSPIQNGDYFWTLSPRFFDNYLAYGFYVYSGGGWISTRVDSSYGSARPAVSLRTGIEYSSGDGTSANPFVISTS